MIVLERGRPEAFDLAGVRRTPGRSDPRRSPPATTTARASHRRRVGFTLVEVLLTLAILVVVLTALGRGLALAHRASQEVDANAEHQQAVTLVSSILRYDVGAAGYVRPDLGTLLQELQAPGGAAIVVQPPAPEPAAAERPAAEPLAPELLAPEPLRPEPAAPRLPAFQLPAFQLPAPELPGPELPAPELPVHELPAPQLPTPQLSTPQLPTPAPSVPDPPPSMSPEAPVAQASVVQPLLIRRHPASPSGDEVWVRYLEDRELDVPKLRDYRFSAGIDGRGDPQLYRSEGAGARQPLVQGLTSLRVVSIAYDGGWLAIDEVGATAERDGAGSVGNQLDRLPAVAHGLRLQLTFAWGETVELVLDLPNAPVPRVESGP